MSAGYPPHPGSAEERPPGGAPPQPQAQPGMPPQHLPPGTYYVQFPYPGHMPQMAPGQAMPRDAPVHMYPTNIAPMTSEMQDARQHDPEKDKGRARRAHHTALERKRRDHIKDMFNTLQAEVDLPQDKASRAMVLQKAREQIQEISTNNESMQREIEDIKRNNDKLLEQIRELEGNTAAQ